MSRQRRTDLDKTLRDGPLDLDGDADEQRAIHAEMMQQTPVPDDAVRLAARGAAADVAVPPRRPDFEKN